jgi:DNA ligase (NAD+)
LEGIKFIFTGEMKSLSRSQAQEQVKSLGGIPKESMSRDIDYVVAGDNPGSKLDKAKE